MAERGYGGPKVEIFDSQGTLLNESTGATPFRDLSLKHIIESLRLVQKETNEFLTKLVHEQTSQNMSKSETVGVEEGKQEMKVISCLLICRVGHSTSFALLCYFSLILLVCWIAKGLVFGSWVMRFAAF